MKNFAVQSGEHRVLIYIAILGITIGVTVTLIPYAGIGMAFLLSAVVLSVLFFRRYELIIVLILISSVMPEIYIPNVLFDLKLTPDFVFLVYGFLLWIFILLTTTNSDPEHKFNLGPITLPAVLFSFVILLSAVISENNVVSLLKGIRLIFWYVIWIYILVVFLKTEKRIYNTLLLLVITIGVLSVISLVELLETVPISSLVSATGRLAGRFMGLSIGEYLSFAILVVFTFWIFSRRFYIKVLYSIAVMVFFALLLLSQTRMAFIATFIGYLFVLMALPRMTKYKLILFGTPVMILLIAIAIVVFKISRDSSLTPELRQIAIAIFGVLTAALIIGVTGGFFKGGLGTFFASLLAMAIACYRLARLQRTKNIKAVNAPIIEGI